MGALVTVQLAEGAPEYALPWLITFGPLADDGSWEPVVCGPYERAHALGLAGAVAADDEVVAVVEPMWPKVSVDEIRAELAAARQWTGADGEYVGDPFDDDPYAVGSYVASHPEPADGDGADAAAGEEAPEPAEVRAAFGRIWAALPRD
ncbi:hypothetical protein GCM10010123_23240 [Pilimelia anulata]|uniref:Uncharacterized protein n=1 Tax=Pilimelia anulata TaxID=53371 RepID=A0A8J3F988_9ACTN|nr:hypothetical protein [Pilimelia anulata]GGJ92703.1 hypothetical protein GCM10010123_23240 [Pilimelia anulata]